VLTILDGAVAHVSAFFDPELFELFGLPAVVHEEDLAR
jgi:hypothetical protein